MEEINNQLMREEEKEEGLNSSLRLLAKTSFIVFFGIFLSKIFTYAYRVIIARQFGPEVYGLFSLALMVAGWFIAFASLGLSEGLLRFMPLYRAKKEYYRVSYIFRTTLIIMIITSVVSGIMLFFLSDFIALSIFKNSALIFYLKIASFLIPTTLLSSPFLGALRAFEKISEHSFIFNIVQTASKLIFLVILLFIGIGSNSVIFSYLLGMAAMALTAYLICLKKIPEIFSKNRLNKGEKAETRKMLFDYSLPLLFSGFISLLFYWIDTFSIGFYKSAFEVGIYNAAIPIAMFLSIAPELFMQLFFPLITREYSKKNTEVIRETSKQVTKWIFFINFPLLILFIIFPGAAINIIFGQQYLAAENALRILAIGSFISSIFIVSTQLVPMMGKSKLVLLNTLLAFVMNFILNSILINMKTLWFLDNSLGINGAALATTISMLFLNILFVVQARKHLKFMPLRWKMINLFAAGIIPLGLLIYFKGFFAVNIFSIILLSASFLLLYVFFAVLFRALDKNDLMILRTIRGKFLRQKNA